MKKNDFEQFKISLNLNIEIDNSLRRITEKIKLLSQLRDTESLKYIADSLAEANDNIDKLIECTCQDESEK